MKDDAGPRAGECWLNKVWGVLVLRVEPLAPEDVRARYQSMASEVSLSMASSPHAWCLVLYDREASWVEGSTRWIEIPYLRRQAERHP